MVDRTLDLLVDFNEVHDGLLYSLIGEDGAIEVPEIGEYVGLFDGEGNFCRGVVTEISDNLVAVEPVWSSWTAQQNYNIPVAAPGTPDGWESQTGGGVNRAISE